MKIASHQSNTLKEENTNNNPFFQQVTKELGMMPSHKLTKMICKTFRALQRSLTYKQVKQLASVMPGVFITHYGYKQSKPEYIEHLDQLVDNIYEKEENSLHPIFHSEIEVLNVVIIVLQQLDKMIGLLNSPGFKFSLVREVQQASLEYAA